MSVFRDTRRPQTVQSGQPAVPGRQPAPSRPIPSCSPAARLSVWYGSSLALKDLTIDIPRNQITALIGPRVAARARCSAASTA